MSSSFSAEIPSLRNRKLFLPLSGKLEGTFFPARCRKCRHAEFRGEKKTPPPFYVGDETEKERDDLFKVRSQFRWREIVKETMSSISGLQPRGEERRFEIVRESQIGKGMGYDAWPCCILPFHV